MSTLLRSSRLIDNCTPSISYDRQVQSACQAFDEQCFEIIDDTGQVIMIPSILSIDDSNLIDILAWQFHVDFYDSTKPLDFRRQLVQNSIRWHMTKGTPALVEEVLHLYWPGGATLEEWFAYMSPLPPNYGDPTLVGTFLSSAVNVAANTIGIAGIANGQEVSFTSTGTLPTPIEAGRIYYVLNATGTTFQIAVDPTGSPPLDLTSQGVSMHSLYQRSPAWHQRYVFRILIDENIIIDVNDENAVLALIARYKPISRWPDAAGPIIRPRTSECDIGLAGMMLRFVYHKSEAPDYP
jgi:hypothetical protein